MSVTGKSFVFIALTLAISWSIVIGGWLLGYSHGPRPDNVLALMLIGPLLTPLICVFVFEKGRRLKALGLRFRPNRWWLAAWLFPLVLAGFEVVLTLLFPDRTYAGLGEATHQMAKALSLDISRIPPPLVPAAGVVASLVAGICFFGLPAFAEEIAWRGYLYDLWRLFGFWRSSFGTGLVWAAWHTPANILFGINYPHHPLIGIGLFAAFCILFAPILTLVRDRSGSVLAAAILHGTYDTTTWITAFALDRPTFHWDRDAIVFIALALIATAIAALRGRPQVRSG